MSTLNDQTEELTAIADENAAGKLRSWWQWVKGSDVVPTDENGRITYDPDSGEYDPAEYVPRVIRRGPPKRLRRLDSWGFYEDRQSGAWSTTRQAEALNLATTRASVQHRGLLAGHNLIGGGPIAGDPFELYRERVIDSVNVCAIGDIGSSKSSYLKTVGLLRQLWMQRQIVAFDKKRQGDVGEYTPIAEALGVESVKFRAGGGGASLNLLDPAISTDGRHDGAESGVVPAGQEALLLAVLADAMERPLSQTEKAAVRRALVLVNEAARNRGTVPLLSDVADQLLAGRSGMSLAAREAFISGRDVPPSVLDDLGDGSYFGPRWAAESLDWGRDPGLAIRELVDGALRGLVDRPTSPEILEALDNPFVHFDLSALPESGAGLRVVMTTAQTWLANRLAARAADRKQTIAIFEEGWFLGHGSTGAVMRENMKLSRGLGLSTWSAFHHLSDHAKDSPSRALMQESDIALLYRQARDDDAREVIQMYHLPPDTRDVLTSLNRGQCLMWMKGRDPILMQHIRSPIEVALTDTDNVLHG